MVYNLELDKVAMKVEIEELEDKKDDKTVNLVVNDLDKIKVELSNSKVTDIKDLFDKITLSISKRNCFTDCQYNLKHYFRSGKT